MYIIKEEMSKLIKQGYTDDYDSEEELEKLEAFFIAKAKEAKEAKEAFFKTKTKEDYEE